MVTEYGNFPGVKVSVAGGGITAVAIGEEEKLILFGEADYQNDETLTSDGDEDSLISDVTGSLETPEKINARREADTTFGAGSELADGMREALGNGANINTLYGVAPRRYNVIDEVQSTQSGTLTNDTIWEEEVSDESNIEALAVNDTGADTIDNIRYTYESPPTQPSDAETMAVNPLTGEYAADAAPTGDYTFDYKYLDWQAAIEAQDVSNVVNEDDTAIFDLATDSDNVSVTADGQAEILRDRYQLVNVLTGAEPNANQELTDSNNNYIRRDARFDTSTYDTANQSVDSDYHFKVAPVRKENTPATALGAVGGLFAGNPINDPIYNDPITLSGDLEQSFTKVDGDNMRNENVIPIRQAGSVRVKDNTSTSTATDWERDFWRRRIVDRVILIGKTIGETIIGRINDPDTQDAAGRLIRAEIRELIDDRLLKPNTSEDQRWYVDVYSDPQDSDLVKIDIGITPFGIVKRVEESIVVET